LREGCDRDMADEIDGLRPSSDSVLSLSHGGVSPEGLPLEKLLLFALGFRLGR
jgi:hypothetical protein